MFVGEKVVKLGKRRGSTVCNQKSLLDLKFDVLIRRTMNGPSFVGPRTIRRMAIDWFSV